MHAEISFSETKREEISSTLENTVYTTVKHLQVQWTTLGHVLRAVKKLAALQMNYCRNIKPFKCVLSIKG